MTRTEYRAARKLYRQNGAFSLRWMKPHVKAVMQRLHDMHKMRDELAERADFKAWCRKADAPWSYRLSTLEALLS